MDKIPDALLKRISDTYYYWMQGPALRIHEDNRFINNYLMSYSNQAVSERSGVISPFMTEDMKRRFEGILFNAGRLEDDASEGNLNIRNYFNVNLNLVRGSFRQLVAKQVKMRPAIKFVNPGDNPELSYYSQSLNYITGMQLRFGKFYSSAVWSQLVSKSVAEGTTYLRVDYNIKVDDTDPEGPKLKQYYCYKPVSSEYIFDDMLPHSFDLSNSTFVAQIHILSRDDAERLLRGWTTKVPTLDSLDSTTADLLGLNYLNDTFDFDTFWLDYSVEENGYDLIQLIEVFWKKYDDDDSTSYKYMRSFLIQNGVNSSGLREIPGTAESPYAMGLPIIRKKHEFEHDSRFGFTPTHDQVEITNAYDTIMNQILNSSYKNSFQKLFMTSKLANLTDFYGQKLDLENFSDQSFIARNIVSNEGIRPHLVQLEHPQIDPQPLQLLDKLYTLQQSVTEAAPINANRTSFATFQAALETAQLVDLPWVTEVEDFFVQLGTMLFAIYQKEYNNDAVLPILRKSIGSVATGLEFLQYNPADVPADIGIQAIVVDTTEQLRLNVLDNLMPILQATGGFQSLLDPNSRPILDILRLSEIGFELPGDQDRKNCLLVISQIMSGKITTGEEVRKTVNLDIDNPAVFVVTIQEYMRDNKDLLLKMNDPAKMNLLTQFLGLYQSSANGSAAAEQVPEETVAENANGEAVEAPPGEGAISPEILQQILGQGAPPADQLVAPEDTGAVPVDEAASSPTPAGV